MTNATDSLDGLTERMAELQHLARQQGQAARHARMRQDVLERFAEPVGTPSGGRWWAWATAVGAVAAAMLVLWVTMRPGPLTFQVERSIDGGQAEAFVAASEDRPLTLTFSDGSAVELQPRARVRVGALRDDGADVVLESGTIEARIEPRASGSWSVAAGPYRVDVVGTAFTVRWTPEEQAFELSLQRGRVHVRGPRIDGTKVVSEGERLVILGRGGERAVMAADEEVEAAADEGAEADERAEVVEALGGLEGKVEVEPALEPERRPSSRRASRGKGSGGRSAEGPASDWRMLAHQGSYREAIAAAEAAGFSRLCGSLPPAALLELADAGRYARRSGRAREALLALRRRFPGTEAAAAAAFDLGRLESGGTRSCAAASKWFRSYLRERPQGSMAEAARRRIDECAEGGAEEAGTAP